MQIFLKDYVLILLKYAALTMLTSSISMALSSASTSGLASLREVSRFTDFVLTNKTASTALRFNCLLRSCFIKSNSTHDANRLSINVSRISLTNGLVNLREVSRFTDFVLTNKTASIALRLNFFLRTRFIKSNRKSPIRRLGIRALSCDQQVHTTDQGPLLRL